MLLAVTEPFVGVSSVLRSNWQNGPGLLSCRRCLQLSDPFCQTCDLLVFETTEVALCKPQSHLAWGLVNLQHMMAHAGMIDSTALARRDLTGRRGIDV